MIARWWRARRAPYEEWHLVVLRPRGNWATLAVVEGRMPDRPIGWHASACIGYGSGSTQMGSDVQVRCRRRADAMLAAEAMHGFHGHVVRERVRHVGWPPYKYRGWEYAPPVSDPRQKARAGRAEVIVELEASLGDLRRALAGACKAMGGEEASGAFKVALAHLARGDLAALDAWAERCWKEAPTLGSILAFEAAREAVARRARAVAAAHGSLWRGGS